jgi:hypothetical protein
MKVGDLVGYINGDGPSGIVLATWVHQYPAHPSETWCEVLWDNGTTGEHDESQLEKV